jgi:hypothetical protein
MSYVPYRTRSFTGLKSWLPPILLSGFLWWISPNAISTRQGLLATVLLLFPWYAYCRWQRNGATRIPLFALISLAYWLAFAMPLFLADPPADPRTGIRFGEAAVYGVMEMAVLGVAALGIGMKVPFRPIDPAMMPDVAESPGAWRYLYCVMGIGAILSIDEDWSYLLGSGGHQLLLALATNVPIAICAMLATKRIDDTATRLDRYALGAFVVARILIGIASGWLSPVVFMAVILALIYTSKHRRLPLKTILLIIPVVLFLQVGKHAFREVYWTGGQTGGVFEKAEFWLAASFKDWDTVFRHNDRQATHALFAETVNRVALLSESANVLVKTPRQVPFQYGKTYSYLAATLIPRAVWPDKPSVNDANRFYQVAYGLTNREDLEDVSISVGFLTESFINFGWWGVVPVMFAAGLLLGLFERTLLTADSGLLFWGIGLALLSTLLTVESQAAQYVGGLLQQIAVVFVVVLPVIRRRKIRHPRGFRLPETV